MIRRREIFGLGLKALRAERGLSQAAMGRILGVSQATLSQWEQLNDAPWPPTDAAALFRRFVEEYPDARPRVNELLETWGYQPLREHGASPRVESALKVLQRGLQLRSLPGSPDRTYGEMLSRAFCSPPWSVGGSEQDGDVVDHLTEFATQSRLSHLIVGRAGAGKTTLLLKLLGTWAEAFYLGHLSRLPVYIEGGSPCLPATVYRSPRELAATVLGVSESDLGELEPLVLIDGLDQLDVGKDTSLRNLRMLTESGNCVVASTRRYFLPSLRRELGDRFDQLRIINLSPWSPQRVQDLILTLDPDTENVQALVERIQQAGVGTPLLVEMVMAVGASPASSSEAEILSQHIDNWLAFQGRGRKGRGLKPFQKRRLFAELAGYMFARPEPKSLDYAGSQIREPQWSLAEDDVTKFIDSLPPKMLWYLADTRYSPHEWLAQEICRYGIVEERTEPGGERRFAFVHSSFFYYLVAEHLASLLRGDGDAALREWDRFISGDVAGYLTFLLSSRSIGEQGGADRETIRALLELYQSFGGEDHFYLAQEQAAYYLARSGDPEASATLRAGWNEKRENGLVCRAIAIGTALAENGHTDYLTGYVNALLRSNAGDRNRVLNRNHDIVYFRDELLPPSLGGFLALDASTASVSCTVLRLLARLESSAYKAIWALDLFTLDDLAVAKGPDRNWLTPEIKTRIQGLGDLVLDDPLAEEARHRLFETLALPLVPHISRC